MTVRELIDLLLDYPEDTTVVVDGYEDGFDDAKKPYTQAVIDEQGPGKKRSWWAGRYDRKYSGDAREEETVVVIPR